MQWKQLDNHIHEAWEPTCNKCSAKDTVENIKEGSVEDADLFMKKDMENKKIMKEKENMKIGISQYERELWKRNLSQYELRLNVDEQHDDNKKTF